MVNWKFLFLSLILATVLCMARAAKAENHDIQRLNQPTGLQRDEAPVTMDPKIIDFVEKYIPPAKTKDHIFLTKGNFATTLVEGLQPFEKGSTATDQQKEEAETKEAKVMANLIKMVESDGKPNSNDQWDKLGKAIKEELSKEKIPSQFEEFLKRLSWTKMVVEKKDSEKPEAQAFNKAIKLALDQKDKDDKELARLADQAVNSKNAQSKKEFQQKLNPETAMNTIAARLNSKDKTSRDNAATELKAMWQKAGEVPYVNFKNGVALFLPKAGFEEALKKGASGIADKGWIFEPNSTAKIDKPWTLANDGNLAKGQPEDARLEQEAPKKPPENGGGAKADKAILASIGTRCQPCHDGRKWRDGAFRNKDGSVVNPNSMLTNPDMAPFIAKLSSTEKKALETFAATGQLADAPIQFAGRARIRR